MERYYIDDYGRTLREDDDTIVADFNVKLVTVEKYITAENKCYEVFTLDFYKDEFICRYKLSPDELDKQNYYDIDSRLLLSPVVSSASKEIAYFIRCQVTSAEIKEFKFFDKLGWHKFDGEHFYCAGDTLIGSLDNYFIKEHLSETYHLEIDRDMTELSALEHTFDLIKIEPEITSLIFIFGLIGITRQLIKDANIKIPSALYIDGNTQTRKTTTSKLLTCMYNRSLLESDISVSGTRVNSTNIKVEELAEKLKDTSFILDDLYRQSDTKLRKEYESHVRNLIRNFADNTPRSTARSSYEINCQLIITAEYLLKSLTDLGRTVIVHVSKPINSERLSYCQKQPLGLSTFYYYFIKWLSVNYSKIVERLRSEYITFREQAKDHKSNYERLYESWFLLKIVFEIYLDYAIEVGAEVNKKSLTDGFYRYVQKTFAFESKILKRVKASEAEKLNFSRELISMINSGIIKVTKKGDNCFGKGRYLYITNNYFARKLYDKYGKVFSAKSITAYFRDRSISEAYDDNTNKKYRGKRYLVLNKDFLNEDANDINDKIDKLFF